MRVVVTGHHGYIGCVLVPMLLERGHEVSGLDNYLFAGCDLGPEPPHVPAVAVDVRDVQPHHFAGADAVIHLAGLSNDPLGDLDPRLTFGINHGGAVRSAAAAKAAGVPRFVFSSSCSLYGAHGDEPIDETAAFHPVTPYGESKVFAERDIGRLADDVFSPVFLRNGTAYGMSTRLRGDLVVNNLVGYAVATGEVFLKSDGSPWRPLVHVDDIAAAMVASIEAPRERVHGAAFNVGRSEENYRVRDVARIVADVVRGSELRIAEGAGPDARNYRVNCDRIARRLPDYRPGWTVRAGVEQLHDAFVTHGMTLDDLVGPRLSRIAHIRAEMAAGRLDPHLRWVEQPSIAKEALHV